MSDLLQQLINIPTDPTDPKFLFSNTLNEHQTLLTSLQALEMKNTSLLREIYRAEYNFTDEKYYSLINKISLLEVKSLNQPNIEDLPSLINKNDIITSLSNLSYNVDTITTEVEEAVDPLFVFQDESDSEVRYFLKFKNGRLAMLEIDHEYDSINITDFYLNDSKNLISYLIQIIDNKLVLKEVDYNKTYPVYKPMRDYQLGYSYRIFVEDNYLKLISVDEGTTKGTFFLNVGNLDNNLVSEDIISMNIDIDEKYMALLPPSIANIIVDIAYNTNEESTVNMPPDIMMGIINNLLKVKRESLINSYGVYWDDFMTPFLEYQTFLEENEISNIIDRLILIEQFLLETPIFEIPFSMLKYSDTQLWSTYYKSIYFVKNQSDIKFRSMFSDPLMKDRIEEIVTRTLLYMNDTGAKSLPSTDKQFTGLEVTEETYLTL